MRIVSGLVLLTFLISCTTTVSRTPRSTTAQQKLPDAPPTPAELPLESDLDFRMMLSAAHFHGKTWPESGHRRLESWIRKEIGARLARNQENEAFTLWLPYAQWLQTGHATPTPEFMQLTSKLMDAYQKMGSATRTLQIIHFLDQYAPDTIPNRSRILWGILELERVRIEQCRFESEEHPERCIAQSELEGDLYKGVPPQQAPGWLPLLQEISFSLWQVPGGTTFLQVPTWLAGASEGLRLHGADRWFAMCLFTPDCFAKPGPDVRAAMAKLNPFLYDAWMNLLSTKPDPSLLEALSLYVQTQLGSGFSGRVCELTAKSFPGHPQTALCNQRQFGRLEYSLLQRRVLVEQIARTPFVRELWDELFQVTVSRFYHLVEREHLTLARQEYSYLQHLVKLMDIRWPSDAHQSALTVQSVAIVDLYMLRGEIDLARSTCESTFARTQDPRILLSWFRLEFWTGQYAKAVELMEKLRALSKESVSTQYYFMKMARYHAVALDRLGEGEKAGQLRAEAAHFFRKLFEFINDPELRTEVVVDIGKLYFDSANAENGLQLFQAALTRSPTCDVIGAILQTLIIYEQVDAAFDVYHTLMDHDTCRSNRRLYSSIWMRFFGLRFAVTDERMERVNQYLDAYSGDSWSNDLAAFARDRLSSAKLISKAGNSGQKSEALYYSGIAAWSHGDTKTAFELFRQVLDLRIVNYTEHEFSFWHIERQLRRPPEPEKEFEFPR
ncbi:hypothetical protein KKC22_03395 [Myxococcota bacterium]|nr:hypothetical protein [Myxococcota bacterium]